MIKAEILKVGEKNVNGFIYSRGLAEEIINQINSDDNSIYGTMGSVGTLPDDTGMVEISNYTHQVKSARLNENDSVEVEIELLDTPLARSLKEYIDVAVNDLSWTKLVGFKPEGYGIIKDGIIEGDGYKIKYINFIDERGKE